MAFDTKSNFGFGLVAIAPSPATTGTTFSMTNTEAALMPDPSVANYNLTIWQNNKRPMGSNAEIIRVTARGAANSGGAGFTQFTITRQQEGTSARTIVAGDFVGNNITKKLFDDLENYISQKTQVTVGTSSGVDYLCDGTADDVEIQAAINAVGALGGGTVLLKRGTYNLSTRVNIDFDNVWLKGEDFGTVTLRDTHSTGLDFLIRSSVAVTSSYRRNVGIVNLVLDGQSKSDVGFTSHNALGLTVQKCKIGNMKANGNWALNITSIDPARIGSPTTAALAQNVLVTDSEFYAAGAVQDLVAFGHGRDALYRNCIFRDGLAGTTGLLSISDGTRENVVVDSCTFYETTNVSSAAIYTSITGVGTKVVNCEVRGMANALVLGGNNTLISNNTFFGGISCRADTLPSYAKITGNTVNTVGKAVSGITLQGDDHVVSNNVVTPDNAGIYLNSSCDRCAIESNIVINPNLSGSQNSGIEVRGTGNIITGNRISDTRGTKFMYRGIYVSFSSDNHIQDNYISGATQYAIAEAGTSDYNEYSDNTFRSNTNTLLLVGLNNLLDGGNNFNVKAFGAIGDGVTNDQPFIKAAMDAAGAAGGGIVYLPEGKYLLNSTAQVVYPNVTVKGAGQGATTLIAGYDGQTAQSGGSGRPGLISFFHTTSPMHNSKVTSLSIDLSYKATSGITFLGCNIASDAIGITIEDVEIYHRGVDHAGDIGCIFFHGGTAGSAWLGSFSQVTIKNCYVHSGKPPLYTDKVGTSIGGIVDRMSNVLIENCTFRDTYSSTIVITGVTIRTNKDWTLKGCKFVNTIGQESAWDGTTRGDFVDVTRTGFDGQFQILNCYFDCCYVAPEVLYKLDTNGTSIVNFQLIEVFNSYNILIDGCTFLNFQVVSGLGFSFPVTNEDVNVVWSNNKFISGHQFGDQDGTKATKFINNLFRDIERQLSLGGYGIHLPSIYDNNFIYNCGYNPHPAEIQRDLSTFHVNEGGSIITNNLIYSDRPDTARGNYYTFAELVGSAEEDVFGNQQPNIYKNNQVVGYGPKLFTFALNPKFRHVVQNNTGVVERTIKNQMTITNTIATSSLALTDVVSNNYTNEGLLTNDILYLGSTSGTITLNPVDGRKFTVTATGPITFIIGNGNSSNCKIIIEVTQDSVGGRTITLPSNVKVSGSVFIASSAPNAIDRLELEWNDAYYIETGRVMNLGQSTASIPVLGGLLPTINM